MSQSKLVTIFKVPFKSKINLPTCLYTKMSHPESFKISPNEINQLSTDKDNWISFNTFFGAFPLEHWNLSLELKNLTLSFYAKGKFKLKIFYKNPFEPEHILYEDIFHLKEETELHIPINLNQVQNYQGIIYPIFHPYEEFTLKDLKYQTSLKEENIKKISLTIIMPTYKREEFVLRNLNLLYSILKTNNNIKVIIIDNGNTFKDFFSLNASSNLKKIINSQVFIFENPNYGGAGGFARGVLEAKKLNSTHVIFSDDDILYEPESINRIYNFFKFASNEEIVVGGGMFNLSNQKILNESGGIYKYLKISLVKPNLNMCLDENISNYSYNEYIGYFGWWFFALPLKIFDEIGLPIPVFFRGDDIEFSYRLKKFLPKVNFTNLLGVGVWHEEFYKKDNPVTDYYITRNGLIFSALYEKPSLKLFKNLIKYIGAALLTYRYERAKYIIKGIQDFMKGPKFLMNLKADKYHQYLLSDLKAKPQKADGLFLMAKFNKSVNKTKLRKLLIFLTLNGHLLPSFFIRKGENPEDDGFIIEPLHSNRLEAIYRNQTVLYYEPTKKVGLLYKYSKKTFFKYLFLAIKELFKLWIKYPQLKEEYTKNHKVITSKEFWEKYLNLNSVK
jgi:GT2 family glycosyltransferase